MDFYSFASGAITATFLLGIIVFLTKTWIEKRIELSIQHEYDKKLSKFENDLEVRLRAELVADLMAEWIKDTKDLDYHRLNQLSFQAFLWLPPQLARDLSNTLAHKPGSDNLRSIIKKIRKHLLGERDDLEAHYVNVFENKTNA
ncbi:hypothetical protein [Metallibacterium scheffleri]|uniref:hypothetical protein n=1 Tax=Metallibacterium scheffleri TaxID=993689 RepID=UPI00109FDF19|nr:hypothetical protein [Metallibacterium scheffleri]